MTTLPVMSMVACKAGLDAVTALCTSTSAVKIYTGAQPATTLTADAGTLLSTLNMSATAFPGSTSGTSDGKATATANAIANDTNAANTGTAGHFRIVNGGGSTVIFQGNCGTSGADMNFNTTAINAGDTVAITSLKVTLACGDGSS